MKCSTALLHFKWGALGVLLSMTLLGGTLHADPLKLKLDSTIASGLMLGPAGREVALGRAPLLLDLDMAMILDNDHAHEWVLGSMVQMEHTVAFALNPQVRLVRTNDYFEGYAGFGIPVFIEPKTRLGTELSFGFAFPPKSNLAFLASVSVATYFMGSDLPDDSTVFTFNGAVGLRLRL
jgi:hypothetical protein